MIRVATTNNNLSPKLPTRKSLLQLLMVGLIILLIGATILIALQLEQQKVTQKTKAAVPTIFPTQVPTVPPTAIPTIPPTVPPTVPPTAVPTTVQPSGFWPTPTEIILAQITSTTAPTGSITNPPTTPTIPNAGNSHAALLIIPLAIVLFSFIF